MNKIQDCFITYIKRSPIGNFAGQFSSMRIDDLLAELFKDLLRNIPFAATEISDVIIGCANQAGEDNRNLARMALLLAQFPFEVPGTTINRLCGSSLDAIIDACGRIQWGQGECFVVGGAESMSRAPYVLAKAEGAFSRQQSFYDTSLGWRFPNALMQERFPLLSMGETAEEVARLHNITRQRQDAFALSSHQKALAAQNSGAFQREILPITIKTKKETKIISQDEGPRADTSLSKLQNLKPAFQEGGTVTAGNSSSINDGAAVILIVSADFLKRHHLTPLARIAGASVRGLHPNTMGLGPVVATNELCRRYQMNVQDFDAIELNEAFAAQSLACIDLLRLDPARINLHGGSIALGHPLGCSGTRIVTTLTSLMQDRPQIKKGLATMCIGVGQGIAVSLENCKS